MKIVKASAQLLNDNYNTNYPPDVYSRLEKIGRVCYKSEDLITPESNEKFISTIFQRGHWAILEHHVFVIEVSRELYNDFNRVLTHIKKVKGVGSTKESHQHRYAAKFINMTRVKDRALISGSATAWNNLAKAIPDGRFSGTIPHFLTFFRKIVSVPSPIERGTPHIIRLLTNEEIANLTYPERQAHQHLTAHFVVDRGVSHELVRHRASFAQESTRYCNYSPDGKVGEVSFIQPVWFKQDLCGEYKMPADGDIRALAATVVEDPLERVWFRNCMETERDYNELMMAEEGKWTPQEARTVLTNSLKTELYLTYSLGGWEWFFEKRDNPAAHPQMREVASILHEEMRELKLLG